MLISVTDYIPSCCSLYCTVFRTKLQRFVAAQSDTRPRAFIVLCFCLATEAWTSFSFLKCLILIVRTAKIAARSYQTERLPCCWSTPHHVPPCSDHAKQRTVLLWFCFSLMNADSFYIVASRSACPRRRTIGIFIIDMTWHKPEGYSVI